jgi:citrate synthase
LLNINTRRNTAQIEELQSTIAKNHNKIEEVYKFIERLRQGDTQYQFSASIQQDKLVKSILNLREELEKSRQEEEQRKKEEQQRHWTNEGLAKFGAILRENIDNLEVLASKVTSNLTRYLNAQQAGFFFIKEEEGEKFIDMLALFAFERKKFPDKIFQV